MIYTIGHAESYRKGLTEHGNEFRKLGRTKDYSGGIVWKTFEEAYEYIDTQRLKGRLKEYSVFSVDADWDNDTVVPCSNNKRSEYTNGSHCLINTSRIIAEINKEGKK